MPADVHRCPSCGARGDDYTVRGGRLGARWAIRFTEASWPRCTRCAEEAHPARDLPIEARRVP